ncbi:S100P-binding protein [Cottoperca gobio]|uniref:S100P-binding protein n=1 Tax=Cottoperca gobio TaxID=56716 RepID=A0A6J2S2I0_COTGO|nr:S100P-binding protein [Cottoperca gobio]
MDKKKTNTISNGLHTAKHLKPLSIYSRMITCEQNSYLHLQKESLNHFLNLKIEVVKNSLKRKLEDCSPDDGYETPAKKACIPKDLSPDLGYFSPPARESSGSSFAFTLPAFLNETQDISSESVSSQLQLENVKCGSSTEPGVDNGTVPHSLRCEKVLLNAPAFDCDVDDILSVNPLGKLVSCENKPVLNPTVAHGQELERGDGQVDEGREELESNVKDEVYFSMAYIEDLKMGKNPSQSVYSQLPQDTSIPLLGEVEVSQKCHPECISEPGCHEQAALSRRHVSFPVCDSGPIVSGPVLASDNCPVETLEDDVEEAWNIGSPILESSVFQTTLLEEESTLDTSYETSLPLQVQVKSVVVALNQLMSTKTAAPTLAKQTAKPSKPSPDKNRGSVSAKCVSSARSQRPVIYDREVDWQREKRLYVHSVTSHMKEHPGANKDVMSELMTLMTHVADQTPGTDGTQWQHPSDLTRRNYQRRFGNETPKMTLHEWQSKNGTTQKRFAKVPKIFERSSFP